jgi:hypothetical protein
VKVMNSTPTEVHTEEQMYTQPLRHMVVNTRATQTQEIPRERERVQEREFKRVQESSREFKRVQESSREFKRVQEM